MYSLACTTIKLNQFSYRKNFRFIISTIVANCTNSVEFLSHRPTLSLRVALSLLTFRMQNFIFVSLIMNSMIPYYIANIPCIRPIELAKCQNVKRLMTMDDCVQFYQLVSIHYYCSYSFHRTGFRSLNPIKCINSLAISFRIFWISTEKHLFCIYLNKQ